ncbi:MAG TPA: shikimate kinase [Blastocatellia bacterium]|nr:shikimate kinase [Blastocatellia bacterium]
MQNEDQNQIRSLDVPIFLTGFMGSGKSTIGQALADLLGRPFIDLDTRIEAMTNRSIPDIIASDGEEKFRQIESEALREVARMGTAVIALGGGAILRAENRELMSSRGISVWLDVPFEVCWQRIQQDENVRPLAPDEATALERYRQRLPFYQQSSLHIKVDQSEPASAVAEEIFGRLGEAE